MSETQLEEVTSVSELEAQVQQETETAREALPETDTDAVLEANKPETNEEVPWEEIDAEGAEPETMSAQDVGEALLDNARDLVTDRNNGNIDVDGYAEADSLDGISVGGEVVYQPSLENQGPIVPGVFAAGRLTPQNPSESAATVGVQAALRERNPETLEPNRFQARIWVGGHASFGEKFEFDRYSVEGQSVLESDVTGGSTRPIFGVSAGANVSYAVTEDGKLRVSANAEHAQFFDGHGSTTEATLGVSYQQLTLEGGIQHQQAGGKPQEFGVEESSTAGVVRLRLGF